MTRWKKTTCRISFIAVILLFSMSVFGKANLLSIKKGSKGDKAWAVMSFDQPVAWLGISQSGENMLTLYFKGNAGSVKQSQVTLGLFSDIQIDVEQLQDNAEYFKTNVSYNTEQPIAILKAGNNVVFGFNDMRLIENRIGRLDGVGYQTCQLVDVLPSQKLDRQNTKLHFNGPFDWVGFLRPSRDELTLLIQGATIETAQNVFHFTENALKTVQLSSYAQNHGSVLRADLLFAPDPVFSMVKGAQDILVQTTIKSADQLAEKKYYAAYNEEPSAGEEYSSEADKESAGADQTAENAGTESTETTNYGESSGAQEGTESETNEDEDEDQGVAFSYEDNDDNIPWDTPIEHFAFDGTSLKNALRLIATSNNLNMVIHEKVSGTVRMNLENVTLRQAMDMLVHPYNCEYWVNDNVIIVKPVNVVMKGGRITKIYRLRYSDAFNVAKIVKTMVSNDSLVEVFHPEFLDFDVSGKNRKLAGEVAVQGIRRTSVLVVTERPEVIKEIDRVLAELDKAPVQILIESKLVEMAPSTSEQLGIDWDKTLTTQLWGNQEMGSQALDYSAINKNPFNGNWQMGYLSISQYKLVLDFLREKTDSKLISNPSLMTMDNEESSISVGTTVPIPQVQRGSGGTGDMVTFDYKEINIQLNVTPHVGKKGKITMYVNPVIEEISGWVESGQNRAPITNKRSVNSIVTVKNGETVVIGGLIKKQKILVDKKVWLLGSIPLIGKFFRHKDLQDTTTNLMIFITPKIIELA